MLSGQLVVKKEKTSSSRPPNRVMINLSMKAHGSKKRKTSEIPDLNLESLGAEEAMEKLISFSQVVSTFKSFFLLYLIFNLLNVFFLRL